MARRSATVHAAQAYVPAAAAEIYPASERLGTGDAHRSTRASGGVARAATPAGEAATALVGGEGGVGDRAGGGDTGEAVSGGGSHAAEGTGGEVAGEAAGDGDEPAWRAGVGGTVSQPTAWARGGMGAVRVEWASQQGNRPII